MVKMKWLNLLIGNLLEKIGLNRASHLFNGIQFFFYDVIKITILLCTLIFFISYIQSYFPPEKSKKILGRFHGISANIIGALLGTVTPFCSCSSIPLFIGFTSAGLPLGVTFSFLISSPMVDLGSLLLLMGIFGTKVALLYVILGLVIAVIGGTIIEKLKLENEIEEFILNAKGMGNVDIDVPELTTKDRINYAKEQMKGTFKKVFPYILIGVGIGAFIHNWIPEKWIVNILGSENPFGVILATLLGVPIYADIFGTIPIAEALLFKGANLGSILSFMMAVTTLSLPSLIMLRKAVKPKLLKIFIIPLFIGFTSAGLPLGVTFSFLISSPMVDLGSLLLLMGIFGTKVALLYVILGLVIAVIGGTIIEKLKLENEIEEFILNAKGMGNVDIDVPELTTKDRINYAKEQMKGTFKKVFPYILIGVGIGAFIHNWIPEKWIVNILGSENPFGVILATLLGVPIYADIFGTIPIAEALLFKGANLGSILSFMMAVTTLSLPSLIMLRKAVKPKLLKIFILICVVGIIIVGYIFNSFQHFII